jgi:hypothetical protein
MKTKRRKKSKSDFLKKIIRILWFPSRARVIPMKLMKGSSMNSRGGASSNQVSVMISN